MYKGPGLVNSANNLEASKEFLEPNFGMALQSISRVPVFFIVNCAFLSKTYCNKYLKGYINF